MYVCTDGRGANDVIMRIAGVVAGGTGRIYSDWRYVATGCNALVVTYLPLFLDVLIHRTSVDSVSANSHVARPSWLMSDE